MRARQWVRPFAVIVSLLLLLASVALAGGKEEFDRGHKLGGRVGKLFDKAARDSGVPVEILVALSYAETRIDAHGGEPSVANGYGVMHLVTNPDNHSLEEAASLTHVSMDRLKSDTASNILGGAAVLASYARAENGGKLPAGLEGWFTTLARYSHSKDDAVAREYARQVYTFINQGLDIGLQGEDVRLEGRPVTPDEGRYAGSGGLSIMSTDYGPALWAPAASSNYTVANRPTEYPINYVIIHVTQGSYSSAINWFQNPAAQVSAHYVVRSSDGQITQTVREKDVAWHAGNWSYNTESIGIEHEGYINDCTWFTDAMYRASAALTRNIADKYGIPKDRNHIIGHVEVPGATHTDPGPCWDWSYYMSLVNATWSTVVDNSTAGRFRMSANWALSSYSTQRYGGDYAYANPVAASDAAYYKVNIPSNGSYEIYTWYPANSGYNAATPVVIWQANANWVGTTSVTRTVNQQINGGRWVSLGIYRLLAGDSEIIAVSRWSSGAGYVIADAFKLIKR